MTSPRPAERTPGRRFAEAPPTAGLPLRLSDFFARGRDFEQEAADWLGVPRLRLACSGTAALVVALTAMREISGRKVVVAPAYTCPLVAIAVARAGLTLRLCDLAPSNLDMDPDGLAAACRQDTLAVIPTHLAGRVSDVAPAIAAARRAGAFVLEDAAQAFGARSEAGPAGTSGDAGVFSLAVGKGLTIYEGGLLWTRDPALGNVCDRAAAALLAQDPAAELRRMAELVGYWALYRPALLRLAYGAPLRRSLAGGDVEGAIGDVFSLDPPLHRVGAWRRSVGASALQRLRAFQDETRERSLRRIATLERLPGVTVFADPEGCRGTWPVLLASLPDEAARDAALKRLWTSGLGVSRLFARALPDYAYLSGIVPPAEVPNARAVAARTLTITGSPHLSDSGFDVVVEALSDVLASR